MNEETAGGWLMRLSFTDLPFGDTPEHGFVHGVEAGGIYQRMRSGFESEIDATVHTINSKFYLRAALAEGWDIELKPTAFPEWMSLSLTKKRTATPNPHGLRVVSRICDRYNP